MFFWDVVSLYRREEMRDRKRRPPKRYHPVIEFILDLFFPT